MFEEAADASNAVRAQQQYDFCSDARYRRKVATAQSPRSHYLRARQFRSRGNVRQISDRNSCTGVDRLRRAIGELGLRHHPRCSRLFVLAISQSGRSPDLLASVASAKASGATILALSNSADSPLMAAADLVIELNAGPEKSVAATKSYLASLAAIARLVAAWTEDDKLDAELAQLPALMDRSWALDWSAALPELESAENLYVVGRGLGLGAAQEIALKCKETCGIHAEAFSSAELRHGPYTLLRKGFPALLLAQQDGTRPGIEALGIELGRRGVPVLLAGGNAAGSMLLPTIEVAAEIAPILLVQSAYRMIASLSVRRGLDPDHPPHLHKITETV